ncbi:MAG: alpha amylase C-terminal domain-containing protein, partial [Mariprofundaceae bacterium]|nr:alpha amylase C-terminal domain-containing protein [Mariprofundaceae bacterium]
KMPGDDWQKFANLRTLYAYMYTHPGKTLLFQGLEFGQWGEWKDSMSLDWDQANFMPHRGLQLLVRDLNHLSMEVPALHEVDFESRGFQWIDCNDAPQSTLSYVRRDNNGGAVVVILNLTQVPRYDYRLGVPDAGFYNEVMNTDAEMYGGSNMGNSGGVSSEDVAWMGQPYSVRITVPPLSTLVLRRG